MTIELGHFALILAFCLAVVQAFFGLAGAQTRRAHWMAVTRPAVAGQFVFTAIAFGCLAYSFLQNDFTVLYVASNSNSALPAFYRFTAVWGAHEGSMLLWLLVLVLWSIAVAAFSRTMPEQFVSRVLGVLGLLSVGFGLFILLTSNPFDRLIPAAVDGRDLNPLLQDPAFAIHPPMLYIGYVGLSVPFAFAIAALLEGKLDASWARWVRPWTTAAWIFLTVGITLGSWWAYYELGWGGWWFWDPVENSSFMPWLVATALIHSLAVTEKRGLFKSWTLLLAIFAFSLSLLGTFLTRSGVTISVHSFASDPTRGLFILAFLCVCIGGALTLYAVRAHKFSSDVGFATLSRESFLLVNNILLVAAAGLILLGTLYPIVLDALHLAKLSVGPSYFNAVFLVPMLPLILVLGIGMHAGWKRADFSGLRNWFVLLAGTALLIALVVPWLVYGSTSILTVVGVTAAIWVAGTALIEPIKRLSAGHKLSPAVLGMCVAHFGLAFFVFGVTVLKSYDEERDLSLRPGESAKVGEYEFKLLGLQDVKGPNYNAVQGEVSVSKAGEQVALLHPQKRAYRVQASVLTEAGIAPAIHRDLIVSMGDQLGQEAWSMRIQYKPMIRFIWLGTLVMALGGFIAVLDRRYRTAHATATAPTVALAAKQS
jgi:cytochrome c-type biogenesis protein CcmF